MCVKDLIYMRGERERDEENLIFPSDVKLKPRLSRSHPQDRTGLEQRDDMKSELWVKHTVGNLISHIWLLQRYYKYMEMSMEQN